MIAIDDTITKQVKAETEFENLLRDQFANAVAQLKAAMPSELFSDIQEGELSALQHEQIWEYAAAGTKQLLAVSLYMARFAPPNTEMHKSGIATVRRMLDLTYEQKPHVASAFTDCVLDYLWPNPTVRREIFAYAYDKDKKLNQALGPGNG